MLLALRSLWERSSIPLTDAGAGNDAISIVASIPLTDSSTGSDAISIAASIPLTDAGAGSDALAVTAAISLTDSGVGSDVMGIDFVGGGGASPDYFSTSDYHAPAEFFRQAKRAPVASGAQDTGVGSEVIDIRVAIALREQARGTSSMHVDRYDPEMDLLLLALAA